MPSLLEWWNFIFLLPLALGLVFGVAVVVSGIGGEADGIEEAADKLEGDGADEADGPWLLSFFGFGQGVPLSLLLPALLIVGGAVGLVLNSLLYPRLANAALLALTSSALSVLASGLVGQGLSRALAPLFGAGPLAYKGGFVGQFGKSVYTVSERGGVVHVKDASGSIHRVSARSLSGAIAPGRAVRLVAYDARSRSYLVEVQEGEGM